jgi:monoamine oxidase
MNADVAVAVVGGGAAGLAAARHLHDLGISTLVLEARNRLGGRAWTISDHTIGALDLGCGWLHSAERNPWVDIASRRGFEIDRTTPPWGTQSGDHGFSGADQEACHAAREAFDSRIASQAATGQDLPASTLLDPDCRWNPLIDAINTYINGVRLDRQSVIDMARYEDTGTNWRLPHGYGALIEAHGDGLPCRFNCPVTAIDLTGRRISIDTADGRITADQVIVTVPTDVLAAGAIRFTPAPDDHLHAASCLPLGLANKLFIRVGQPGDLPCDGNLIGSTDDARTGSYHLRPFGRPMIEGFFSADLAADLEAGGLDAFFAFARAQLGDLLGGNFVSSLSPVVASAWHGDKWARGSYSHALPGHADSRRILAAPVQQRLYFAGEASSPNFFSTAHGAMISGIDAAARIAAAP